jgi:hypothetical protein
MSVIDFFSIIFNDFDVDYFYNRDFDYFVRRAGSRVSGAMCLSSDEGHSIT